MQAANVPTKFPIPFASSASGSGIRPIPQASQIGVQGGAASLTDGFPPATFAPVAAGGVPPWGADFNGILNQITKWNQWHAAGGPIKYDSAFQASIGGYPQGAVIEGDTLGNFYLCLVDNNATNPNTGGAGWKLFQLPAPGLGALGQCRMDYVSATQIALFPYNGSWLCINGVPRQVPAGGVNLANTGLAQQTLYYIYAAFGSSMSLIASTTGHVTDANGTEVMAGDASKALVGMVYMDSGTPGIFADSGSKRFVISWFNRKRIVCENSISNANYTNTGSLLEVSSAGRAQFIMWVEDDYTSICDGTIFNNTTNGGSSIGIGLDGPTFSQNEQINFPTAGESTGFTVTHQVQKEVLTEGFHFATIVAVTNPSQFATIVGSRATVYLNG